MRWEQEGRQRWNVDHAKAGLDGISEQTLTLLYIEPQTAFRCKLVMTFLWHIEHAKGTGHISSLKFIDGLAGKMVRRPAKFEEFKSAKTGDIDYRSISLPAPTFRLILTMRQIASVFFALLATQALTVQATDWTEFRGSGGQGHADQIQPALQWSESENITWKVELPGVGWSSPVVAADSIYVTTAVLGATDKDEDAGASLSLRTIKLNADSGEVIWDKEVFRIDDSSDLEFHKKNSHASPTPIFRDGRIYVHFGPYGTACLNESGDVLWKNTNLIYSPTHGNGGSPALAENRLIICCDGNDKRFVVGLDSDSGEEVWRTEREFSPSRGFSFSTPTIIEVAGESVAICPGSGGVFAYTIDTGKQVWRVNYDEGYSVVPRPVVGNGLVYVCSGFGDSQLFAIDPNGSGDITDDNVKWKVKKGVPKSPSILLVDESIYMVDDAGIATCVNALTGDVKWQKRLKGKYSASPVFAGGHIYFQSETGKTTVVKPGDSLAVVETNQIGDGKDRTFASFAFDGNAILLRSETALYRIEDR